MTHSPPIPAGNTSPYPLHEPPHSRAEPPQVTPDESHSGAQVGKNTLLGLGAAITLGVGATFMALWFAQRKAATTPVKSVQRAKRKRASNPRKRTVAT